MASRLSKATKHARKGLIIFLIFAISTFIFSFIFSLSEDDKIIQQQNSTGASKVYLEPNQALGNIPYPYIKSLPTNVSQNTTYSIQDRDVLPEFPPVFNVYEILKPREKLGNVARGNQVASNLMLNSSGRQISDSEVLWQSSDLSRNLTYDKVLEKWKYTTDLSRERLDTEQTSNLRLSNETDHYANIGTTILSRLGLNKSYFDKSNSKYYFVNSDNLETFTAIDSARQSKYVYINQYKTILTSELNPNYRPKQNELPSFNLTSDIRTMEYLRGSANFLVRGPMDEILPGLVKFDYHDFNIGNKGIYDSLTSTEAFLKLQNGEGILYFLKLKGTNIFSNHEPHSILEYRIDAQKTQIIYIEPIDWSIDETWTQFLQPYYLFEGAAILEDGREADFAIILPGLKDSEYVK